MPRHGWSRRKGDNLRQRVRQLAERMAAAGQLPGLEPAALAATPLELRSPTLPVAAGHFVRYLTGDAATVAQAQGGRLDTTLDASLQGQVQTILDSRLRDLRERAVGDGAVLVMDHTSGEIVAWVNGGGDAPQLAGSMIDAILTPRQPGSTLKPFLYAAALDAGWSAATLIDDAPLSGQVGAGLHAFRNYSRQYYGPLRLRECLGNSLNTPAVRTLDQFGTARFLALLHRLGFASLNRPADVYGLGLALGNGEVTLLELTDAYSTLARAGRRRPLRPVLGAAPAVAEQRIFSAESASLVADILSDPAARQREFGRGSVLAMPLQTAVKTGTSTDYCDAWALGFNHRYVVGVWMGNLDRRPMREVTGSRGPALVLRSVFAELNRGDKGHPLFLSPRLAAVEICERSGGAAGPDCPRRQEWFPPGSRPLLCRLDHGRQAPAVAIARAGKGPLRLLQPTADLQLAMDPRIPNHLEAFAFELLTAVRGEKIEWLVDGKVAGTTGAAERRWLWPLEKGKHTAQARIHLQGKIMRSETVSFTVK